MLRLLPILVAFVLHFCSCKKKREVNPCDGLTQPKADFAFKEILNDTAFYADTIFRDNYVNFVASKPYQSVLWKIGNDPRDFKSANFTLSFVNSLETITVNFTGWSTPNTQCFPDDKGVYNGIKQLTIVEQFDKPNVTLSPLVGRYRGAFTNTPNDTFTLRINYFDSVKYDVTMTGSKNFYWISNIPKNYKDSTSSTSYAYPELRSGQPVEMGYKCLQFGSGSNSSTGRGYAELVLDTLKIYYHNQLTGRKIFLGKRI
jgi:hypothetical protein